MDSGNIENKSIHIAFIINKPIKLEFMFTVNITKEMIAHELCEDLCGIAEACQDQKIDYNSSIVWIKDFDNGK
jgi:hypothetical protein